MHRIHGLLNDGFDVAGGRLGAYTTVQRTVGWPQSDCFHVGRPMAAETKQNGNSAGVTNGLRPQDRFEEGTHCYLGLQPGILPLQCFRMARHDRSITSSRTKLNFVERLVAFDLRRRCLRALLPTPITVNLIIVLEDVRPQPYMCSQPPSSQISRACMP